MQSLIQDKSARHCCAEATTWDDRHINLTERLRISDADLEGSIIDRFDRIALHHASRLAVKWRNGEWTYNILKQKSEAVAHALRKAGMNRIEPVALFIRNKPLAIASMLGVLRAGGFFVPLDPKHPSDRMRQLLEDANPPWVLTEADTDELAKILTGKAQSLRVDRLEATRAPASCTPADAVAYLVYTSGSTGRPKGVVHTHRNLLHNVRLYSDALEIGPHDRATQLHSVSFSAAMVDIFCPLLNGGAVLAWDFHDEGLAGLGEWLETSGATLMNWAPSPFRVLSKSLRKPLASLQTVILGSEPLLEADVALFQKHFPEDCTLYNRLGATEVNHYRMFVVRRDQAACGHVVPAGYAMPDKELLLLTAEGSEANTGELGEIVIRSEYCSPGYWNQPELSAERFNPVGKPIVEDGALCFPKESRTYRTGDLGRLRADGCLEFHGRADQQVKIRGYRIELGEIEGVVRAFPGIADVAVAPREDGENGTALVAFVVRQPGATLDERELRQSVRERLPDYMMPASILELKSLPITPTGKLDRKTLQCIHGAMPLPLSPRGWAESPLELEMIGLWENRLHRKGVGPEDDFFTLGGDSLRAVQLLSDIQLVVGKPVPNSLIFEAPTPRAMAARLAVGSWTAQGSCVVPLQPKGNLPPLFLVHNCVSEVFCYLQLARALGPDQPVYGLRALLAKPGELAFDRIEDMASNFLTEIRAVQATGPYHLAGSAVGALIAYDMAQQLHRAGDKVGWLGIAEAWPHHLPLKFRLGKGLLFTWSKAVHHVIRLPRHSGREILRILARDIRRIALVALGCYQPEVAEANRARADAPGAADLLRVQRALLAAHWAYRPRPYAGQATLFWSGNQGYRLDLPWQELIGKQLKIERVPGCHSSIWRGPNAEVLSQAFRRHLRAVQ